MNACEDLKSGQMNHGHQTELINVSIKEKERGERLLSKSRVCVLLLGTFSVWFSWMEIQESSFRSSVNPETAGVRVGKSMFNREGNKH